MALQTVQCQALQAHQPQDFLLEMYNPKDWVNVVI